MIQFRLLSLRADDYPNRHSWLAASTARRRALAALDTLEENAGEFRRRIEGGYCPYGSDARRFAEAAVQFSEELSKMELMRDMLEWHAADIAEKENKS